MSTEKDLRQKVLKASLALIGEGGLDSLSLREVARKAGVSHQAPYHHFGDRESILAALAGEGFAKLNRDMERAVAGTGTNSTRAVEAVGRAYVEFALHHRAYFQVMFRADAVPLDKHPEARTQADATFGSLVRVIDQAFAGESAEARRIIAFTCWGLVHGLATLLLDGQFARRGGTSKARQKKIAEEVIGTFSAMLDQRRA
jgi:AcrR family transcriptional regulator